MMGSEGKGKLSTQLLDLIRERRSLDKLIAQMEQRHAFTGGRRSLDEVIAQMKLERDGIDEQLERLMKEKRET